MTEFAETKRVLTTNYLQLSRFAGEHMSGKLTASMLDAPSGYIEFDPAVHDPSQIDPLAPVSLALGVDHVREVEQALALHANVVLDSMPRQETPGTTERKRQVAGSIATLFERAMPVPGEDRVFLHNVIESGAVESRRWHRASDETLKVATRGAFMATAADAAKSRLTVVVSDFNRMVFPPNSLPNAVAVVVEDATERRVVDPSLAVSLGGDYELHTTDRKQVARYEALLEEEHAKVVDNLQSAGARVVSIITDPRLEAGYDIAKADQLLASALGDIAQRA